MIVSLDARLPASTVASSTLQLDALLRSDRGETARAALVSSRGVARLCSLLRGGKEAQPSSLRDAPGAKVLTCAFGALEALIAGAPELREEAVATGAVTTSVKLLHYLLASEQEAPLGKAHKLPMRVEPELLPNLLLLLVALVEGPPPDGHVTRIVFKPHTVPHPNPTSSPPRRPHRPHRIGPSAAHMPL